MDRAQWLQVEELGIAFAARLVPGVNDHFSAIDSVILQNIDVCRVQRLMDRIDERQVPKAAHRIFTCVLARATEPCLVSEIAEDLGLTVRTLQRHCAAFYIPPPKRLVSLARIFTVERLVEWSRQSTSIVATALGFSDRANYSRLLRRTLSEPSSVIREQGGADHVAEVIVRAIAHYSAPNFSGQ